MHRSICHMNLPESCTEVTLVWKLFLLLQRHDTLETNDNKYFAIVVVKPECIFVNCSVTSDNYCLKLLHPLYIFYIFFVNGAIF